MNPRNSVFIAAMHHQEISGNNEKSKEHLSLRPQLTRYCCPTHIDYMSNMAGAL